MFRPGYPPFMLELPVKFKSFFHSFHCIFRTGFCLFPVSCLSPWIMGLNLATIGIGVYVAGALAAIVRKATHGSWYPQDLNNGKLENYFFFLAAIMLLNFVAFVFLAQRYKYVKTSASSRGSVAQVDQQSNLVNL